MLIATLRTQRRGDRAKKRAIRRTATLLGIALKIGQLIVEFNLHPHRSKRLDEVRHARQHEAGTKFNDHLRSGIDHPIAQSALKHADDAPYSGFGTVFSAQPDRQSVLVEHWGALIGHLRREAAGVLTKTSPLR
jgi:hypothetical protein